MNKNDFLKIFIQVDEPTSAVATKTAIAIPPAVLEELQKHYETVFAGANLEGVDFFVFYALIAKQPKADQGAYVMALDMVRTMNSEATVATLSENAAFYLQKFEEAAASYVQEQEKAKNALLQQIEGEKTNLNAEISRATQQIQQLEIQLAAEREKLKTASEAAAQVDAKYAEPLAKIETNLAGNQTAKTNIIARISAVIENLKKFVPAGSHQTILTTFNLLGPNKSVVLLFSRPEGSVFLLTKNMVLLLAGDYDTDSDYLLCTIGRMNKQEKVTTFEVPGISDINVVSLPEEGKKGSWKGTCERCAVEVGGCLQYMPDGELGFHCCHKHLYFDSGDCKCPHTYGHENTEAYVEDAKNCIPGALFFGDDDYQALTNPVVAGSENAE